MCTDATHSCQRWLKSQQLCRYGVTCFSLSFVTSHIFSVVFLCLNQEYEPTIYHPKRSSQSLHQDFTVQCEKMDIPFLSYLPTEVSGMFTE